MNKIKVGAVSYLNTKPLLYGLKQSFIIDSIDLIEDYPAKIAAMLINNEIDLGLIPVAVLPKLNKYFLVSDYCIGANDAVASVSLFSHQPIEKINIVLLDYQSKTSVMLAKILFKYYWKKEVRFIDASENYIDEIKNNTAGVIIGDRALEMNNKFTYIYDLASAWKSYTGLPFVFATWVANKQMDKNFMMEFDAANKVGLDNIDIVIKELDYNVYDLKTYYTQNISYDFNEEKKQALKLFIKYIREFS